MAQDRPQLLSGARGVFQRTNKSGAFETVAFVTNVSVNRRAGTRVSYVLGRMNGAAHDPLSIDVDISIGRVIPVNPHDAVSNGSPVPPGPSMSKYPSWIPPVGANQTAATQGPTALESGLESVISKMTTDDDFTLAIFDVTSNQYVSSVHHCRYAGGSLTLNSGDVGNESLNYVGIYDAGNAGENSANVGYGLGV